MERALDRADLKPIEIDYINLHGTGTPANDLAEDRAVRTAFGGRTPCSSTKGRTGHTLGAAGITEAILSALCLRHDFIPGTMHLNRLDPQLQSCVMLHSESRPLRAVVRTRSASAAIIAASFSGRGRDARLSYVGWHRGARDGRVVDGSTSPRRPFGIRPGPISRSIPDMLSAAERRRSSPSARLAMMAAQDAFRAGGLRGDEIATVFASSDGDGAITQEICDALAGPAQEVSPTSFHNSVFNAPAGYWSIATHSRLASTSLCAFDVSFAAGLIEAAAFATVERQPVMLIASDVPFPAPLHTIRPVEESFAAALLLSPTAPAGSFMRLEVTLEPRGAVTTWPEKLPKSLRSNPAARCLPPVDRMGYTSGRDRGARVFRHQRPRRCVCTGSVIDGRFMLGHLPLDSTWGEPCVYSIVLTVGLRISSSAELPAIGVSTTRCVTTADCGRSAALNMPRRLLPPMGHFSEGRVNPVP